jgi:hypothetical protein
MVKYRINEVTEARKVEVEFICSELFIHPNFVPQEERKLKYEYLLWKVVAEGDIFYNFKILKTEPKGEVQITPKTRLKVSKKHVKVL